jgi:hypothetical protein
MVFGVLMVLVLRLGKEDFDLCVDTFQRFTVDDVEDIIVFDEAERLDICGVSRP